MCANVHVQNSNKDKHHVLEYKTFIGQVGSGWRSKHCALVSHRLHRTVGFGLAAEGGTLSATPPPPPRQISRVAERYLRLCAGGVEQLEKQLHLQDSEQDSSKSGQVGSGFSRSLYDRVLNKSNNRGNSAFSGGSSTTPRYV